MKKRVLKYFISAKIPGLFTSHQIWLDLTDDSEDGNLNIHDCIVNTVIERVKKVHGLEISENLIIFEVISLLDTIYI